MGANGGSSGGGWKARGFSPPEYLDYKYGIHRNDFNPPIDKTTYNYNAVKLLNSKIGGNILGFTSKTGLVFRYNTETNEFAIARPDGSITTYFRPTRGLDYWLDQEEKYGR